jgi:hypothetical protein
MIHTFFQKDIEDANKKMFSDIQRGVKILEKHVLKADNTE